MADAYLRASNHSFLQPHLPACLCMPVIFHQVEIYEVSELVADAYQRASTHLQPNPKPPPSSESYESGSPEGSSSSTGGPYSTSAQPFSASEDVAVSQPDPRLPLGGASPEAFSWACSVGGVSAVARMWVTVCVLVIH